MEEGLQVTQEITQDGYLVDTLTGEVLEYEWIEEEWVPTTEEDVDYLLSLIQELEAAKAGFMARSQAITKNLEAMAKVAQRKKDFLIYRFGPSLEAFAASKLKNTSGEFRGPKTLRTAYGSLGFRRSPRTVKVLDEGLALDWCVENVPEAIKSEYHVLVSKIPDIELPPCFEVVEEKDKFSIDTGAEK